MKKIFFVLTLGMTFISGANAKDLLSCKDVDFSPKIEFSTSYGKLYYDFSKNTKAISRIAARIGHKESSAFATGLATVNVENEYVLGTKVVSLDKYLGYCVVPEVIKVYIGFSNPVIYISKELTKNSCQYNMVMLHEQTHQRINKAALDYFIPYFQLAASKLGTEIEPIHITKLSEIDAATDEMTQAFTQKYDKILAVFKKELTVEQGKLDNKTNYSIEDDICKNFNATHSRR